MKSFDQGIAQLKNPELMGALHTNLKEEIKGFNRLATFYALKARGDVELIITKGISTNPEGRLAPNSVLMTNKTDVKYHTLTTQPFIKKMKSIHTGR